MFSYLAQHTNRRVVATFAGAMAFPVALQANVAPPAEDRPMIAEPAPRAEHAAPNLECLANTICAVKDRVRWRSPAWTPSFCEKIAQGVLQASEENHLPPALILAVMVNESDLNEKAFRLTVKNGKLYAKDGGLMGIRCILDGKDHCTNAHVRGMAWKEVMDPVKNIAIGARELAHWREGGGVTTVSARIREPNGKIKVIEKRIPCPHKTHAYWAHYNHGPRYIDHGPARHYPHRIGVLYYTLAKAMDEDTTQLTNMRLTVIDKGKRPRTADHPVEARYQKLCRDIRGAAPGCGSRATAGLPHQVPVN